MGGRTFLRLVLFSRCGAGGGLFLGLVGLGLAAPGQLCHHAGQRQHAQQVGG